MINTPRNIPKPPTMIIANKIVPKDVQAVEIEEEESSVSVLERVMKKKPVVNSDDETIVMEDYFSYLEITMMNLIRKLELKVMVIKYLAILLLKQS